MGSKAEFSYRWIEWSAIQMQCCNHDDMNQVGKLSVDGSVEFIMTKRMKHV